MKTLKPTKTWILICLFIVASSATEDVPSHHDVTKSADTALWEKHHNTIIPYGIQMPDHVLSRPELSCVSADNNIFEIMKKAQDTCNGTDMRCTFYHFLNDGYENIGTLDINKERFDGLLMKFDNWLLTAENIEKRRDKKTIENSSLATASIDENDGSSISIDIEGASRDGHIDKLNLSVNESDDVKVRSHHLKTLHETHNKIHHGKDHNSATALHIRGKPLKNHIKLKPEYNANHRYFEVYIPRDKFTGKPRTIYVEVDQDKNEFILIDEEIDKKLHGNKPIRIELDELSGIADTAFNEITKTSIFKELVHHHLSDDEKAIISDISKHSSVNVDAVHSDIDEQTQNSINSSGAHPNIYNIESEEPHKSDNTTGNVKKIVDVNENVIVLNNYINQTQFNAKSNIDNSTDDIQNDKFELLENNNTVTVTDLLTDFYENREHFDTIEYKKNNTFSLNGRENSSHIPFSHSNISYEYDNDTSTDFVELSAEHENVTLDDNFFAQFEENNDTSDDTNDFSSPNTLNLNELTVQVDNPIEENKFNPIPFNNAEPTLTSSITARISDYANSQLHAIPFENRQRGYVDLHDISLEPLKPYASIPNLGKDSAKILKTDSHLKSPSPTYITLDLHAGDSKNTGLLSNSDACVSILGQDSAKILKTDSHLKSSSPTYATLDLLAGDSKNTGLLSNSDACVSILGQDSAKLLKTDSYLKSSSPTYATLDLHAGDSQNTALLSNSDASVSILGQDLAKILKTDSHLKSSSPMYATLDLHAGDFQNTATNFVVENPSITSYYIPPLKSVCATSAASKVSQKSTPIFPSPPAECIVDRLNKDSKFPSYSKVEEMRLPGESNHLSLDHVYSLLDPILPLTVPSMEYTINSQSSPGHKTSIKDTTLIQSIPSSGYVIQEPTLITTPYELETTTPAPAKHVLLSKLGLPKSISGYEIIPTANPSTVEPYSLKDAVSSPCQIQEILPCLKKTILSPMDSGLIKKSPCDNISKETMIPWSVGNRYPYLTPPQYRPSYLEPLLQSPVQPSSIIPTLDFETTSLYQSNPWQTEIYPQDKKTIQMLPLASNSQISHLNPMLAESSFPPYTSPCSNIWNNLPYLPNNQQNIKNNPQLLSNYLTPTNDQNQKPLPSILHSSMIEYPCSSKNTLENTPSSYTSYSPLHTSEVQKHSNPSFALERDLESPSLKYDIPLSKILHTLDKEITNKEVSESNLTNVTPLDSSLTGPHLELKNSLNAHDSQSHTIISETTGPVTTAHINIKNEPTKILLDSSLIGPHLSTLSPINILHNDDNRNREDFILSESDSSNLIPLGSSLIGPHLEIDSSPVVLDSHISQADILTSPTNVLTTSSSQIESIVNQNKPTNLLLDSSSTDPHLQTLSSIKPLLSNEIQSINKMIPLESELTDLTPLDLSQVDLTNKMVQSSIPAKPLLTNQIRTNNEMIPLESDLTDLVPLDISEAESSATSPELHKITTFTNTMEGESLLKQDLSRTIQLDSSLIGPELRLESSPIVTGTAEEKTVNLIQNNLKKTKTKVDESESIILPSSLLLNGPVKDDAIHNVIIPDTKLKEETIEISVDANVTPLKETDFKIIKQIPELQNSNIIKILSNDSTTLKLLPEMSPVDYEPELDNSLIGTSLLPKAKPPVISTNIGSSTQLENSLVGPSKLNEINSQSPVIETVDQLESSLVATTIDQSKKPIELTVVDSTTRLDSSLMGSSLYQEIKPHEASAVYDSVIQFDNAAVAPSLYETGTKTSTVLDAKSHVDTTLVIPSLYEAVLSASSSALNQLDSSLLGTSSVPEIETKKQSHVSDSNKLESTLVGPHLISTVPFSSDEFEMKNKDPKLDLANVKLFDSTLLGPHIDFESHLDQNELFQYQNQELSLTSEDITPGIETLNFLNSDNVERHKLKPNTVSRIYQSDLEKLLFELKNSITKSQQSSSEFKPCDKLLSSSAKQSTDNINITPTCSDMQSLTLNTLLNTPSYLLDDTASEFSQLTLAYPQKELETVVKEPCPDSNYYSAPQTFSELLPYTQGVPQILCGPYSPSIPIKQMIEPNWIPQPINIENILQASSGITPTAVNAAVPLMPLSSEDLKLLSDLSSQSKYFPQLSMPNIATPIKVISPSLEWTSQPNILPPEKYVPSYPKKNYHVLPSNFEFSVCNSEYTPKEVDDNISLIDENSYKLLKDLAILPSSQCSLTPSISLLNKGEFVSPSLSDTKIPILYPDLMKRRPVIPISISTAKVPLSIYTNPQIDLYKPQSIPYMIPRPNVPPCNLQPYSETTLDALLSDIVRPAPKILSLPIKHSKPSLESQRHELPNTPQLMEFILNPTRDLLSKPSSESPIKLPSSLLDTMLQSSTALHKPQSYPSKSPTAFLTPVSPAPTTPLSNAFTSPVQPICVSPLSVSYGKPNAASSTRLPLNVPYLASPPTLISSYTASSAIPEFSSSLTPLKSTPLSNYPIVPTEIYNRQLPSKIPFTPYSLYSSPYSTVYTSPLQAENRPYSPTFMSELTPAETNPISSVFYEPLTARYLSAGPKPKSLTNFGMPTYSGSLKPVSAIPVAPSSTGVLPPSYISSDLSTYKYSATSDPVNTMTQLLSPLSTPYTTSIPSVTSNPLSYNRPLKPMFNLKLELTPQEIDNLRLQNTLPVSNANKAATINIPPLQIYHKYVTKPAPLFSSQIKKIQPSKYKLGSNFQTTFLTEETPCEVIEEDMYKYSNDKDNKYYEESMFKYPSESLLYTLAPEEIIKTERRPRDDFIKLEDLTSPALVANLAFEPSFQSKLYGKPLLTSYTPLYGESSLKPCSTPQLSPHPYLIEPLPQYSSYNIPLEPSSQSLNHPVPASKLSNPLLKPLTPLTPPLNLPSPCIDTYLRPYKILPTNEKLSFSSPYHSATNQGMLAPSIDPKGLRKIISPQLTSDFSQVLANAPCMPISSSTSPLTSPYNLNDYIELPLTYNEPKVKAKGTLIKPFTVPNYNQYASKIISPLEMGISSKCVSSLKTAESLKKPHISPQYISSILPGQTKLQEICPLHEAPLDYQLNTPQPTGPSNAAKNVFKSPTVTSPYTVLPSVKMVEPISTNLYCPQWYLAPQYSIQVSSSPVSKSSPVNYLTNLKYSTISPNVGKLPMSNHFIPSALFMSLDAEFQTTPLKKSKPLQNLPRYSYPSPTFIKPLEMVSYETLNKPLGQTIIPQNIYKPSTQYHNGKYTAVPLSTSSYEIIDSFQSQSPHNVQYTNQPYPKLSPLLAQYTSPSYTSLSLETVPNLLINKPPQYRLSNGPTYNAPIQSSTLRRNPFLNPDSELITEVPSYLIPNNKVSSLKLTPESFLLSNLKPLSNSQEALESSSKPLTKALTHKSHQYQPKLIPINAQYVSQSQTDSVPQLLPSTSPILKGPLIRPLLTNSQNYSPSPPIHISNSNITLPKSFPLKALPFDFSNHKYSSPSETLVSELLESLEPINALPTTHCSLSKPLLQKQYQSPVTMTNMPLYSNYDVQKYTTYLPVKSTYMDTVKPIEVTPISTSKSSLLSLGLRDAEIIEEMIPYELRPDLKDQFSHVPLNMNRKFPTYHPALPYVMPLSSHINSASTKYKTPRPSNIPSVILDDVELIDTTDFIPISPVQSEGLTLKYSTTDRKAPISSTPSNIPESNIVSPYTILPNSDFLPSTVKQLPPKSITNTQSMQEPDIISQFFPYAILSNSESSPSAKQLPPITQNQRNNQIPQSSPVYLNPKEYEGLTEDLASAQTSSSPITLPSTKISPQSPPVYLNPQEYEELTKGLSSSKVSSSSPLRLSQLIPNLLTASPIPLTPIITSTIYKAPENLLQLLPLEKYSPSQETPTEITAEKESIQSLLNKNRPLNKITPLGLKDYPYDPKSSIVEFLSELDSVKSVNPLIKSKESYVEYKEDIQSNNENNYVAAENVSLHENKPDVFEAKSFTESLAEKVKGVSVPNYYNNNVQIPQRLSTLEHLYANSYIGKTPKVFTTPTLNTSPKPSSTDGVRYTTISPEIYKDSTVIPIKHLGSVPTLDASSRLTEYYPEIENSVETVPITNAYTKKYISPSLKSYSQLQLPNNVIEATDTSEIPSTSYNPLDNMNDINYSRYKAYQLPSLKCPKTTQNLETPLKYSPSLIPYYPNVYQTSSLLNHFGPTEIYEPITPQYQTPETTTFPLQTKLGLDNLQKLPEFNDFDAVEDEPVCIDDIKEDNELKTSLINYINKRDNIKNNLNNKNQEITIPVGNIAIIKKEPYIADTIKTNNPSIGLKVWKSNVKIAQAELKLKFKDLSVINFMPVANKLDKYDMEEIRKIVKNYIDEKYGNHVEINKPYTVDNQYTVIKDFDPNGVSNKYNLLWPTNYV